MTVATADSSQEPSSTTVVAKSQADEGEINPGSSQTYELITRNLQEVLGGETIRKILEKGEIPKCYWGTAPTGRPHIGYFVPLTKIADFLHAGVEVTILLADVHAFLDNLKAPIDQVKHRVEFYSRLLRSVFQAIPVPVDKLRFVVGSSYQLTERYNMDNYKLCAIVTEHDAKKAGAEVVKQVENPILSGLLYPGLQALDEEYLGCDFQFGGADQRKIFTFAEQYLPKLGYRKRAHLMNTMVPGLAGSKMSSSDPNSKIDLLDPPELIKKKINKAFCEPGNVDNNGVLSFVGAVLIPISVLRLELAASGEKAPPPFVAEDSPQGTVFTVIGRGEEPTIHYKTFEEMKADFKEGKLRPENLKPAVVKALENLLRPVQQEFLADEEWKKVETLAYPPPPPPEPKKKKKDGALHRGKPPAEVIRDS